LTFRFSKSHLGRQGCKTFLWIDCELAKTMGSKLTEKMVISFALLLLVFSMSSFADNNNSSNNSNISQSQFNDDRLIPGNESQIQANNISANPGTISLDVFKGFDISSFLSNGANLLTILAILAGLILWLFPRARNKIIEIFKLDRILGKDGEVENQNTLNSEKDAPPSLFKLHPANPNFTGREKFLDELHQSLVQATSSPKPRSSLWLAMAEWEKLRSHCSMPIDPRTISNTSGGYAQKSPQRFLMTILELPRTSSCPDGT
jgi:hypothetical protein